MRLEDTNRLEAFSDGVMAVIITIMAFGVKPPDGFRSADLHGLAPELLVYVLSFVMIGIYWNNHHHLLRAADRMNASVMWSNLFLLFWLSLFPVVTAWVGKYPNHALPAAAYGVVGLWAGFAYWVLVRTIIRANGTNSTVSHAMGNDLKGNLSLLFYAAGIGLAAVKAVSPIASYVLYGIVAVMWLIPDRRLVEVERTSTYKDHGFPSD